MIPLTQFEFLRALGSALFDSLWQFGIFWMVFRLAIAPVKSISASVKHGILISFLTVSGIWFCGTLLNAYFNGGAEYKDDLGSSGSYLGAVAAMINERLPLVAAIYLLVVVALFIRLGGYFLYARKIQTEGLLKPGLELRLQVNRLAERLGISRKIDFWLSELIDTPMIIGFLKPTILMPVASLNQLSVSQLEAILLHELAHIKRNDYLLNIYVSSLKILFFFNPFCRMLVESVRQEREKSCDDWVLQFRFDPHQYATALFQLESVRSVRYSLGIAAGGSGKRFLLERIERILAVKTSNRANRIQLAGYFLVLGLVSLTALIVPVKIDEKPSDKSFVHTGYRLFESISNDEYMPQVSSQESSLEIPPVIVDEDLHSNTITTTTTTDEETTVTDTDDEVEDQTIQIIQTSSPIEEEESKRDFSIKTADVPDLPAIAEAAAAPFVPHSSFNYHPVQDTSRPKIKEESYSERSARESLVKAKKALAQVDWEKIQKELIRKGKVSKTDLLKLLENSLEKLNWNDINNEVSATINQQSIERWRSSLKAELDDAKKYKELQQQYQLLKDQLQKQQQNVKTEIEIQSLQLDNTIKKNKVIVHL